MKAQNSKQLFDHSWPFYFSHGTNVAGFIAAERDNNVCVVGVAYRSTILGEYTHWCWINILVNSY